MIDVDRDVLKTIGKSIESLQENQQLIILSLSSDICCKKVYSQKDQVCLGTFRINKKLIFNHDSRYDPDSESVK